MVGLIRNSTTEVDRSAKNGSVGSRNHVPSGSWFQPGQSVGLPSESTAAPGHNISPVSGSPLAQSPGIVRYSTARAPSARINASSDASMSASRSAYAAGVHQISATTGAGVLGMLVGVIA